MKHSEAIKPISLFSPSLVHRFRVRSPFLVCFQRSIARIDRISVADHGKHNVLLFGWMKLIIYQVKVLAYRTVLSF